MTDWLISLLCIKQFKCLLRYLSNVELSNNCKMRIAASPHFSIISDFSPSIMQFHDDFIQIFQVGGHPEIFYHHLFIYYEIRTKVHMKKLKKTTSYEPTTHTSNR